MHVSKKELEEAVLAVLYDKSQDRPLWVNASEVYWSLPFAEVSEGEVAGMLAWLVEERRVELYLGKYQLSKDEQIRLKAQRQEPLDEERQEALPIKHEVEKPERQVKPSAKSYHAPLLLAIFFLGLFLGGLSWSILTSVPLQPNVDLLLHPVSLEELRAELEIVQDKQRLQGYLLLLLWVILLAVGIYSYYVRKRSENGHNQS
ncbi:DUF5457 domain-containing protein [Porphyromonas catoniae]|uniref:DUF5457 domain-containing protein n=1 Tax=Porphyromonas catoniae TaxID=41976 RepID=UPI0028D1914F|nr:DUF5457 domain-containing protein [Porphyromonas catoniae]